MEISDGKTYGELLLRTGDLTPDGSEQPGLEQNALCTWVEFAAVLWRNLLTCCAKKEGRHKLIKRDAFFMFTSIPGEDAD